jgi:putative transposase
MENGHIESFNGRLRDKCLYVNQFLSLDHARETIKAWQYDYNHHRPHGSLGNLTSMEYRVRHAFEWASSVAKLQL